MQRIGFAKVLHNDNDSAKDCYYNELFLRGRPDLLALMGTKKECSLVIHAAAFLDQWPVCEYQPHEVHPGIERFLENKYLQRFLKEDSPYYCHQPPNVEESSLDATKENRRLELDHGKAQGKRNKLSVSRNNDEDVVVHTHALAKKRRKVTLDKVVDDEQQSNGSAREKSQQATVALVPTKSTTNPKTKDNFVRLTTPCPKQGDGWLHPPFTWFHLERFKKIWPECEKVSIELKTREGDPGTWLIVAEGPRLAVETFNDVLCKWLTQCVIGANHSTVLDQGEEFQLKVPPGETIGAIVSEAKVCLEGRPAITRLSMRLEQRGVLVDAFRKKNIDPSSVSAISLVSINGKLFTSTHQLVDFLRKSKAHKESVCLIIKYACRLVRPLVWKDWQNIPTLNAFECRQVAKELNSRSEESLREKSIPVEINGRTVDIAWFDFDPDAPFQLRLNTICRKIYLPVFGPISGTSQSEPLRTALLPSQKDNFYDAGEKVRRVGKVINLA